jgi:tungstate transport system permease protein
VIAGYRVAGERAFHSARRDEDATLTMSLAEATQQAFARLAAGDAELWTIVWISLKVSLLALVLATTVRVATGFWVASHRFAGRALRHRRTAGAAELSHGRGGPRPLLLFSRSGPLGPWHLLFTQDAMIIGQAIIAFPCWLLHARGDHGIRPTIA